MQPQALWNESHCVHSIIFLVDSVLELGKIFQPLMRTMIGLMHVGQIHLQDLHPAKP